MNVRIESGRLILSVRATPQVLAVLPQIEGRRTWLKGGGLSVEDTAHNRAVCSMNFDAAFPDAPVAGLDLFDIGKASRPFKFKRDPDPHQSIALSKCADKNFFGQFMEQGTGKTKVAIDRACQLFCSGEISAVLVVTKKGVHRQWIEAELPKDHGEPYLADWWRNKEIDQELFKAGPELKWWSINYDALRGKVGFAQALKFCRAHGGRLLIIADESQCIMNHTSSRHKKMIELKVYSSHRLLLTGTPQAKDLTDEWAQLKWLDESIIGCKYLTTFRAKYCIMGGYEGRAVIGAKNLDEFKALKDKATYRVTKEEIGYIPKRYSEWSFDLTADQHRLMAQVKKELLADLGDGQTIEISSVTAAFTKIQQIASGFIINEDQEVVRLMPVNKNPRVQAALEYFDSRQGKQVIWTRFIADRELLAEGMRDAGFTFVEYSGPDAQRLLAKNRFINDDSVMGFLANPASAGTGTDGLQTVCTQAIYYTNSFNAIDRWQSEDRIDRRGMIGGSQYTDLMAKKSLDRYIFNNLKKKKGMAALSMGDVQRMLDEI